MLGLSNSLRQRLGNDPEPHLHPDADLLTAYAERSLSPAEQADMVRHLAACSYCREVVALSLPEMQVQPAVASQSGRFTWWMPWGIPVMRWAAVAATLVVGATLVIEKPWKPSVFVPGPVKNDAVAESSKQAPVAPSADAGPAASGPSAPPADAVPTPPAAEPGSGGLVAGIPVSRMPVSGMPGSGMRDAKADRADLASAKTTGATRSLARTDETRSSGPKVNDAGAAPRDAVSMNRASVASAIVSPPAPPVATADANLISGPTPRAAGGYTASETGFVVRQLPSLPITAESIANSRFAVSFDGASPDNDPQSAARHRASTDTFASSRIFKAPAKVASAGKEKLSSVISPRPGAGLALMEKAPPAQFAPAERVHWSISPEGKLIKSSDLSLWHEAYPQKDNLLFRVVVAEGHDVWAGGNQMTLIHSWNGGVDWKKLKLSDAQTGDITDIQIGDGDVQVKTSNNQTFVSQDGGVTWVPLKQQPK